VLSGYYSMTEPWLSQLLFQHMCPFGGTFLVPMSDPLFCAYCVCIGDGRRRHIVILTPKFALTSRLWKQARSNWNFDTMCRIVTVRSRL